MKKFIGKPYAGKPHVRIDVGAGEVFLSSPALLYCLLWFKIFAGFILVK
jgi:hypothetical protein